MINLDQKIYGYRRDNNRVGIRNYVVILPVDDISNAVRPLLLKAWLKENRCYKGKNDFLLFYRDKYKGPKCLN